LGLCRSNRESLNSSQEFFNDVKNIQESWERNNHLLTKIIGNVQSILPSSSNVNQLAGSQAQFNQLAENLENQRKEEERWLMKMKQSYPKPNTIKRISILEFTIKIEI
jgi:hypothetical protein